MALSGRAKTKFFASAREQFSDYRRKLLFGEWGAASDLDFNFSRHGEVSKGGRRERACGPAFQQARSRGHFRRGSRGDLREEVQKTDLQEGVKTLLGWDIFGEASAN